VADAIRLIEVGPESSVVYDGLGRVVARTNELGQTTTYQYDAVGNQTLVTLPDPDGTGPLVSSFTASAYDSLGQLVAQWNAENETTLFGYNARGKKSNRPRKTWLRSWWRPAGSWPMAR
jgi:YD repeat-containing protein